MPDIDEQERRDRVPSGTYRELVNDGRLLVADGLNQPEPDQLLSAVLDLWGPPACVVADRFKAGALQDAVGGRWPVEFRIMRWSEQTEDVDGIRKLSRDWCIGVDEESRRLLAFSGRDGAGRAGHVGQRPAQEARHAQHVARRRGGGVRARGRRGGAVAARQAGARGGVLMRICPECGKVFPSTVQRCDECPPPSGAVLDRDRIERLWADAVRLGARRDHA